MRFSDISFDAELETVTDFMEDRSMPWSHWHVGVNSEMDMAWGDPGPADLCRNRPGRRDPFARTQPGRSRQGDRAGGKRGSLKRDRSLKGGRKSNPLQDARA